MLSLIWLIFDQYLTKIWITINQYLPNIWNDNHGRVGLEEAWYVHTLPTDARYNQRYMMTLI